MAGKYLVELILGDKSWCITKPLCKSSLEYKSRAPLIFCVLMEETPAGLSIKAFCRNLLKLSFNYLSARELHRVPTIILHQDARMLFRMDYYASKGM